MRRVTFLMLMLFVFSIPFENGVVIPGVGSVARVLGLAALGVGIVALFEPRSVRVRPPSLFVALMLVFVLHAMSTYFWSAVPSATLSTIITLGQLFVMAWLVWEFARGPRELAMLMQAFVLGSYATIGVALMTFLGSDSGFRDVGAFNPNEFAIVSALAIPMAWRLGLQPVARPLTLLNWLYPAFAVFAVILSASRGGLLTTIVALAIIPLTLPRMGLARRIVLLALISATAWVAFVWAPQVYPDLQRNIERLSETSQELSGGDLTGRAQIWQVGIRIFHDRPLSGHGFGTFGYVAQPVLGVFKEPHNAVLAVATGGGLPSALMFVSLLFIVLLSVVRAHRQDRVFLMVTFGALIVGMTPTNADTDKYLWFVLALLAHWRPLVFSAPAAKSDVALRSA